MAAPSPAAARGLAEAARGVDDEIAALRREVAELRSLIDGCVKASDVEAKVLDRGLVDGQTKDILTTKHVTVLVNRNVVTERKHELSSPGPWGIGNS